MIRNLGKKFLRITLEDTFRKNLGVGGISNERRKVMDISEVKISKPKLPPAKKYSNHVSKTIKDLEKTQSGIKDTILDAWFAHEWVALGRGEWANKSFKSFCEDIGQRTQRVYEWFEKASLPLTTIGKGRVQKRTVDKPVKKHTKPETKKQLTEITQEIEEDNVSDADVKEIGDTIAKKVENGTISPKAVRNIVTASKKRTKETAPISQGKEEFQGDKKWINKSIGEVKKSKTEEEALCRLLQGSKEGLQRLVDKEITLGEYINSIRHLGPGFMWDFHRLGVDMAKVYNTLVNPKGELNETAERSNPQLESNERGVIIDAEFKDGASM
jgi:DNA repair exonuclease SbcCD ATPase subunit